MPLLCDARPARWAAASTGFGSIRALHGPGHPLYNPPPEARESNYFAAWGGLPSACAAVVGRAPDRWRISSASPQNNSAPRTEAAILYRANTVTRWFAMDFVPASGLDAWLSDVASYTTICQWHERDQPNGGRTPPFELSVYDDAQGPRRGWWCRTTAAPGHLAHRRWPRW